MDGRSTSLVSLGKGSESHDHADDLDISPRNVAASHLDWDPASVKALSHPHVNSNCIRSSVHVDRVTGLTR